MSVYICFAASFADLSPLMKFHSKYAISARTTIFKLVSVSTMINTITLMINSIIYIF